MYTHIKVLFSRNVQCMYGIVKLNVSYLKHLVFIHWCLFILFIVFIALFALHFRSCDVNYMWDVMEFRIRNSLTYKSYSYILERIQLCISFSHSHVIVYFNVLCYCCCCAWCLLCAKPSAMCCGTEWMKDIHMLKLMFIGV